MIDQIFPLHSERKLAYVLGVKVQVLRDLARRGDQLYRSYDIKKASGNGSRRIDDPDDRLKEVQSKIKDRLLNQCPFSPLVFGGVPGRSVRDNAIQHVGRRWVVATDIESYFPSVKEWHVAAAWRRLFGTGRRTTALLTRLTTYAGRLPQGAPTSSALANHVLGPLLEELKRDKEFDKIILTSWVDDIAMSGNSAPRAIPFLVAMLRRNGLKIARKKTKIMANDASQQVTKLVVNVKASIGSERKRFVRSVLRTRSDGPATASERGLIAHAKFICEPQGTSLQRLLDASDS